MSIKYVWFDLGYTLVYMQRDRVLQNTLFKNNIKISLEETELAFHITDKLFMREHREFLYKDREELMPFYLQKLLRYLKVEIDIKMVLKDYYEEEEIQRKNDERVWVAYESSLDVLSMLKQNSIGVGLISNWDSTAKTVLKQNKLDLLLDDIIISSEVNCEKPNEEIFKIAMNNAGVKPEECLFVGDNYYDDILGSRKVKMQSILINPYDNKGIEELTNIDTISNISKLPQYIETKYKFKLF